MRFVPLPAPDRAVRVPRSQVTLSSEHPWDGAVDFEDRRLDLVRDRGKHDRARVAEGRWDRFGADAFRARFETQPAPTLDITERERRGDRALECVQLDAELRAASGEAFALVRADASEEGDAVA